MSVKLSTGPPATERRFVSENVLFRSLEAHKYLRNKHVNSVSIGRNVQYRTACLFEVRWAVQFCFLLTEFVTANEQNPAQQIIACG
jgi:hypothetical protein